VEFVLRSLLAASSSRLIFEIMPSRRTLKKKLHIEVA
jgi:hypothetical protein